MVAGRRRLPQALQLAVLIFLVPMSACGARTKMADFTFHDLSGSARGIADLAGRPAVLVFWRSDCGPCLVEFQGLADLQDAARPGRLVTVAVEDSSSARETLSRMKFSPAHAWMVDGTPERVLSAFADGPPRLPLAVAVDSRGLLCKRHIGLLGSNRVRKWMHQCS